MHGGHGATGSGNPVSPKDSADSTTHSEGSQGASARGAAPVWCHPRPREEACRGTLEPRVRQAPDGCKSGGTQPPESRRSNRRRFPGADFSDAPRLQKHHEDLKKFLTTLDIGSHSNARVQARCGAIAEQRRLQPGVRLGMPPPLDSRTPLDAHGGPFHKLVERSCVCLLDHLVRLEEDGRGNGEAQFLRRLEVDDQTWATGPPVGEAVTEAV
jgi:hypothetical protein